LAAQKDRDIARRLGDLSASGAFVRPITKIADEPAGCAL
jgi:hypothetical protein